MSSADEFGASEKRKLVNAGKMHWIHWFIVALSIVVTFGAWYYSDVQVKTRNFEKFNRQADQVIELVKERMHLYENALWGGVALIDSKNGDISYSQWRSYANSLRIDKAYPGINGIGVIFQIEPDRMNDFLETQREDRPDFRVHPKHNLPEYWPITYIEPLGPNSKAVGLDMAFETNRYAAVIKSRDTGVAQVTGPISLVQDDKKTPGFLLYAPFYEKGVKPQTISDRRDKIIGVTYAPFIMKNLMQGTLSRQKRQIHIEIMDGSSLLYEDEYVELDDSEPSQFSIVQDVVMYGRIWTFSSHSTARFQKEVSSDQPYWILIGGLTVDGFLLALFLFMTRANRTALSYAERMTRELKDKSERLERSNEDLEQFSYVASHDLKAPLNSIKQIISWIEEDCKDILPDKSKEHIELLKARCARSMTLLNDLLDYSRVNRFAYDTENISLKKTVDDIMFLLGHSDGFSCEITDCNLVIQRRAFEIVLRNLITNSIKHHSLKKGHIKIECERNLTEYLFRISDDGPGIPDNLHAKALEMFSTLRPRDQVEGSGMGLAMVKKIIEHHGGSLEIEKGRVTGTCIIIRWPFNTQFDTITQD